MGQYLFEEVYFKDKEIDVHIGVRENADDSEHFKIDKQAIYDRIVDLTKIDLQEQKVKDLLRNEYYRVGAFNLFQHL